MLIVRNDVVRVESNLAEGLVASPACGGVLRRWGWARGRVLRGEPEHDRLVTPRTRKPADTDNLNTQNDTSQTRNDTTATNHPQPQRRHRHNPARPATLLLQPEPPSLLRHPPSGQ